MTRRWSPEKSCSERISTFLTLQFGGGGLRSKFWALSLDLLLSGFGAFSGLLLDCPEGKDCDAFKERSPFPLTWWISGEVRFEGGSGNSESMAVGRFTEGRMTGSSLLRECSWPCRLMARLGLLFLCRGTRALFWFGIDVSSTRESFLAESDRKLLLRLPSLLCFRPFRIRPISRPTSKTLRDMIGKLSTAKGQMRSNIRRES